MEALADEEPRDWLARPAPRAIEQPVAAPAPQEQPLPSDLPAFRAWLLADASVPGLPRARHDAVGDPAGGCMVVADMPEPCDRGTARLLTGEAGALFDRMLAAIGLGRDAIYLAPFAPARPASGKLDKAACATLERLMRHHLALAAPKRVLLLGDAPVCALLGCSVSQARGRVYQLQLGPRTIPAVASFPPRLVQGAELRRSAWADLQAFRELA